MQLLKSLEILINSKLIRTFMQKIDFSYDINRKRIIVIFKNNFLIKNKSLLEEVVKSSKLPKNSNVTPHRNGERKNVCNIEIP